MSGNKVIACAHHILQQKHKLINYFFLLPKSRWGITGGGCNHKDKQVEAEIVIGQTNRGVWEEEDMDHKQNNPWMVNNKKKEGIRKDKIGLW